jgi:hypothetical protein
LRFAAGFILGCALVACPKDEARPEDDRTIARLKAEQERLARGGAPAAPPTQPTEDPLAAATRNPQPTRPLSVKPSSGTLGDVEFTLKSAHLSQNIKSARLELTTSDHFIRVVLAAKASASAGVSLASAALTRGELRAEIARDAQRVGQGSPLSPIQLDPEVTQELVLYFEGPPGLIGPGLTLVLTEKATRLELLMQ